MNIPDFLPDTRFFQVDGYWRTTRPAKSYSRSTTYVGSWYIYPDGRIQSSRATYEEFLADNYPKLSRDDALAAFRTVFDQQLP